MAKKKNESPFKKYINIKNRKASYEYEFIDKYTCGLVLQGTEIKSIRTGMVNLQDSFCLFLNSRHLIVRSMSISHYSSGTIFNHDIKADRKLLLSKRELRKLEEASDNVGLTIIPIRIFINDRGFAKLEIALARGKKLHDKRNSMKDKDAKRDMDKAMKSF